MIRCSRSDPYECITALAWVNNREVKAAAPRTVSFNVVDTNNRLSVQMVWIIGPWSPHGPLRDRSRSRLIFVIKFGVAYHHWADGEACADGLRTSRWSWACDIITYPSLVCGTLTSRCHAVFLPMLASKTNRLSVTMPSPGGDLCVLSICPAALNIN
jgi:hypothetical protein